MQNKGSVGKEDQPDHAEPIGERKPSTPEEERALEKEELESFRRRRKWFEETFGDVEQPDADQPDRDEDVTDD